jgi:hypothetical protein
MVARRSEMSAEWKVRFAICIASVAIQAFTKLLFSFSDVLQTTNCTFQEVDNIFCLAVGIAVYDEFFSYMCAAEFLCALDVFASGIDRKDLIQYKEKNANNRVPFVITYHPALSNLSNIVREHWAIIQKHPELCKIFNEPPVLAFRKPKSLKDILVRADISPRSANNGQCQKCDSRRCMTCKNIQCTHKFSSTHTGEKIIIYCNANCKTENIIYLLESHF